MIEMIYPGKQAGGHGLFLWSKRKRFMAHSSATYRIEALDALQRDILHTRRSKTLEEWKDEIRYYQYPVDLSGVDDLPTLIERIQEGIDAVKAEVPRHDDQEQAPGLKGHTGPRPDPD
jgi:hypothetical protein